MDIEIGGRYLKFGIDEFVLIIGLTFDQYPNKEVPHSTKLVSTYLNNNAKVKSYELEVAFYTYSDKEDFWKLRLLYFVDNVLYLHDANYKVEMSLFSLVESKEDFLQYLFGRESMEKIFIGLDNDMVYFQSFYTKAI